MPMSRVQRDAFLRETRIATLATLRADGSPTLVPIWFEWDGEVARMFTDRDSPKAGRLRVDPRAALCVEAGVGEAEAWVVVEGSATINERGGMELAERLARRYYDPARAEQAVATWRRNAEQWVVVELRPSRIGSLGTGELPRD